MELLKNSDFSCIGVVALHCDNAKLCIAENEAITFDLNDNFCGYGAEIVETINEVDDYISAKSACDADPECLTPPVEPEDYENKYKFVYGGNFESQCGKRITFLGVKRILTYYTYARYIVVNGFNDTATGLVKKSNDFSLPIALSELQAYSDKYRNMAYSSLKNAKYFISYSDLIIGFPFTSKTKCYCGGENCGYNTSNTNGFGVRSRIITK